MTAEIIGGTVRLDLNDYKLLPFVFIQCLNLHRDFVKQQTKDDGGQ